MLSAMALAMSGCSETLPIDNEQPANSNYIEVGVETSGLIATSEVEPLSDTRAAKAQDAETVSWLVQPLKQGLHITYGKVGDASTEQVAILKLESDDSVDGYKKDPDSKLAVYSFNYESNNNKALWYGNGLHYFKGVHVPMRIRYNSDASELESDRTDSNGGAITKVTGLTTDQSNDTDKGTDNDLGNYTLLSHYLSMPANTRISATVERIKLPFRHRLAHVMAYIIIDPALNTTIKGYKKDASGNTTDTENPNTSSIKFCNVQVLQGVKGDKLTPQWTKVRKAIPHFYGEEASLVVYKSGKETVYPKSSKYESIKASGGAEYTKVTYQNVPVYDLIVRPTYTSTDSVMYDEEDYDTKLSALAANYNQIDFLISLENGLTYEKSFVFDLDANYETVVYLHITREGVDYNDSGAALWEETKTTDEWYGVDNKNGNTLSRAGSSWQRAYTRRKDSYINDGGDKVTDGGYYDEGTTGEDDATGQYLREATWIKYFSEAYEGGAHHGDYFNLSRDITIDARSLPDNFVFTGHLDGFGDDGKKYYTLTLTNTNTQWKEYVETTDYSLDKLYDTKPAEKYSNVETTSFSLPSQLYTKTHHDEVYYQESELTEVDGKTYVTTSLTYHEAVDSVLYTEGDIVTIGDKTYDKNTVKDIGEGNYSLYESPTEGQNKEANVGGVKVSAQDAYYEKTSSSIEATTETIKTAAYDTYHEATPTIAQVMTGTTQYYTRSGEAEPYTYTAYVKPEKLYKIVQRTSGSALFAGLNGIYDTKQETDPSYTGPWEANVHKETNNGQTYYWLPYRDTVTDTVTGTVTGTGWRAEVMNLTVKGAKLFKEGAEITGNVDNCKDGVDGTDKVTDHIPALPKYK